MKLKITSDGTIAGTKVQNAETGELVGGVQSASLLVSARSQLVTGAIIIRDVEFIATADFIAKGMAVYNFLEDAKTKLGELNIDQAQLFEKLIELANQHGG